MEKKLQNLPIIQPDSIDKITDLSVLFIRKSGPYESSSEDAWTAMRKFIDDQHLNHHGKLRYFSIAHDNPMITSEEKLRFDACIYTPDPIQPQAEIGRQTLKKGRYAVFTHDGPHSDLDHF